MYSCTHVSLSSTYVVLHFSLMEGKNTAYCLTSANGTAKTWYSRVVYVIHVVAELMSASAMNYIAREAIQSPSVNLVWDSVIKLWDWVGHVSHYSYSLSTFILWLENLHESAIHQKVVCTCISYQAWLSVVHGHGIMAHFSRSAHATGLPLSTKGYSTIWFSWSAKQSKSGTWT